MIEKYHLPINMEVFMEEVKEVLEETTEEILPRKPKRNNNFKTKKCRVISYNKTTKTLDILFDQYGIRIYSVFDFQGDTIEIKYKGTIGKPNFVYKL